MTIAILAAMWVSMVFTGGIVSEIKEKPKDNIIAQYHIEIRPNGEALGICEENDR